MKKIVSTIGLVGALAVAPLAMAEKMPQPHTKCKPTVADRAVASMPVHINNSNYLRRQRALSNMQVEGKPIMMIGRVVSENCTPIEGARVALWQTDKNGVYPHLESNQAATGFMGSGETYTNNLGEFTFYTILPGIEEQGGYPVFNVHVQEYGHKSFTSRLFLPGFDNPLPDNIEVPLTARVETTGYHDPVYGYTFVLAKESETTNRF